MAKIKPEDLKFLLDNMDGYNEQDIIKALNKILGNSEEDLKLIKNQKRRYDLNKGAMKALGLVGGGLVGAGLGGVIGGAGSAALGKLGSSIAGTGVGQAIGQAAAPMGRLIPGAVKGAAAAGGDFLGALGGDTIGKAIGMGVGGRKGGQLSDDLFRQLMMNSGNRDPREDYLRQLYAQYF